ncbi:carboxylesterase/lipase family protein [Yinghuangia aomiensis]
MGDRAHEVTAPADTPTREQKGGYAMLTTTPVTTTAGPVEGVATPGVRMYRGVPYAAPPVGAARFRPPRPAPTWTAVRRCAAYGPAAAQPVDHLLTAMFGGSPFPTDEDCLTLNIWTLEAADGKRPVLVWLHGGAFVTGSGRDPVFDGERLAVRRDVVVVTVNYRLGAFGFLHLAEAFGDRYAASGNLGLLDQAAALRWVRDNIAAFGGDAGNVTVFGQSAGAMSVTALMAMPSAKGLFHKAVVQSGNAALTTTPERAGAVARRILDSLGADTPERLAGVPTAAVIGAQEAVTAELQGGGMALPFLPVVDGDVLPESPLDAVRAGAAAGIPLIVGATAEESRLFLLAGAAASPGIDEHMFHGPTFELARAQAAQTPKVWLYRFAWRSTALDGRLGACHSLDLPFVFDNLDRPGVERFTGPKPPQSLADAMSAAWTSFARDADPGRDWPAFAAEDPSMLVFDERPHAAAHPPV